jgi:hypothetical protein
MIDHRGLPVATEFIERHRSGEHCHSASDGECDDRRCPQIRDGEPAKSGRHCPLDCLDKIDDDDR